MADTIKKLTIEGYKSIRKLEEFELGPLNVLIGANGAGKSNFVSFFRLVREIVEQRLQRELQTVEGGADACLYLGPKVTKRFAATVRFGQHRYGFSLAPTPDNRFIFADEFEGDPGWEVRVSNGVSESVVKDWNGAPTGSYAFRTISNWAPYHFQDTSLSAGVRRQTAINDNEYLRSNAENLASFLYRIQHTDPANYSRIRDVVRLAAPFFDDFKLRPIPHAPDMIQLEWMQRGSDYPFRAHQLSDGTLRFICLATALLQPQRPATVIFDEPELGLHPHALTLLGNLFKQGSSDSAQIIVSTQSAQLLNEFEPQDVIVVERANGESTFRRLNSSDLSEWLDEYTLGELWQKNVLGGRPRDDRVGEPVASRGNGHS